MIFSEQYQSIFSAIAKKHTNEFGEVDFFTMIDEFKNLGNGVIPFSNSSNKVMPIEKMIEKMSMEHNVSLDWLANVSENPLEDAFSKKNSSHSFVSSIPVPKPFVKNAIDLLADTKRTTKSAIYINVPFCQTRCAFCMFYISGYKKEESKRYTDYLIREMRMWEKTKSVGSKPIHAVYIGGGTPTALESEDLYRIISTVKEIFPLANDCEFTVEGRLSYFTDEKIESCLKAGANRFSLGIQSFDTQVRQRMGRLSSKDELIKGLEHLCSYDNAAVIIDLIFGLPGQNQENWAEDLKIVGQLPIDGVDLYQLIMLENSPLKKMVESGKMPDAPTSKERARMYKQGFDYLTNHLFKTLSVSHLARTTRERNIYNVLAKSDADTLAFGPGAGGKIQGISFMNIRNYEEWLKAVDSGYKSAAMIFVPAKEWRLYKHIGEQLELGYLDFTFFKRLYSIDLKEKAKDVLEQWNTAGLLKFDEEYAILTFAGKFWAVTMSNLLINYIQNKIFANK